MSRLALESLEGREVPTTGLFSIGNTDPDPQTKEHVLLARQTPVPSPFNPNLNLFSPDGHGPIGLAYELTNTLVSG